MDGRLTFGYECSFFLLQQESRWTYGTAVSGVVIHLNKIDLKYSQILRCPGGPSSNPNVALALILTF